jgi:pyruvate,water dikinase
VGVAPGRASGAARIIRHPAEGHLLQTGEVLVAPSTDPGWTPLFLRASAIVMEVGGYLSHGAIVAREYGIPAVVNIPGLLDTVRDCRRLEVDGDAAHVLMDAAD